MVALYQKLRKYVVAFLNKPNLNVLYWMKIARHENFAVELKKLRN